MHNFCYAALHIRVFSPFAYCILNMCEGARDERRIPCNNSTHTRVQCCRSVRKGRGMLKKFASSGREENKLSFPLMQMKHVRYEGTIVYPTLHTHAIYRVSKGYACV